MTIRELLSTLTLQAATLPKGIDSPVVAWVRVPNAGESAVLEVSSVAQGYRQDQGGTVLTINLDARA
jgi:hypothetical protein